MKYIKKNHLGFIVPFITITLLFGSFSSFYSSDVFREEIHNGGHFDRVVEKEIDGVYAHKFVTPTDNYYTTQKSCSMSNVGDIETVWNTYTGEGTKIAVIDDGFEPTHPEYLRSDGSSAILSTSRYYYQSGSKVYYKSYSNDSTCLNEEWDDEYSEWATHGTNTSSTAAAPMNNGGIVGIAPGADILALKIDMSFGAIKSAIDYAISQEVDVINMSLGAYAETFIDGYGDQQSGSSSVATYLDSICQQAHNAGIIVVAAAGNEATSHKSYPACNDYVIGVGALYKNSNTNLATFTNFNSSETQTGNKNVDILAPGYVYAAGITGKTSSSHSNTYHDTQGTSFSSPIVAGAACLWKEKYPEGTPDQFEADLTSSAAGIGSYVDKTISPSGTPLDTNIACGRLDVGSLMKLSHDVSSISISESSHNLYKASGKGEHSFELSATISPDTAVNKNITWSTSNSSIASISKSSSVSGEKITISAGNSTGNATITATSSDGGYSATCTVTVSSWINVSSFVVTDESGQTSGEVSKGHTKQLIYTVLPSNATDGEVIFMSNDEDIATVSDDGTITAKAVGSTTITGLCSDDSDYLESEYSVEVTSPSGTSTFEINLYNSSTLTNTTASEAPTLELFQNATTINGEQNKGVVTSLSQSKAYQRLGGVAIASGSTAGNVSIILDSKYAVDSVQVIACMVDTSPDLKINNKAASSGSYNAKFTALANCSEVLTFTDLAGATTLNFTCSGGKRATIYKICGDFIGGDTPTPTTNYTVSFNANGGDGTMSNQQTTGSTFVTPNCTFTYTNKIFSKWALNSTSGTQYAEGETIKNITANIELFAIWVNNEDNPYYSGVDTSSPSNLETWLHNKISSGTTDVGYDGLWTAYASTDCKPGTNLIWDMYSDEDFECGGPKQGHSYSKEGDGYNREHTVPQSWFNESSPMKSDLFHVYPTDGYVNNRRSNYPHGDVSSATYTSNNGSKLGTAGYSGMSGTVFEVIDEYKGDFARSYFYFATRYSDKISAFTTDGKKVFSTSFPHMNSTFINQYYSWHLQDPVSSKEINRNNAVYKIQGNRNPYIDHPEWVQYIFNGQTPTVVSVTGVSVSPTSTTVEVNKTTTLTATVSPSDATNKAVTWSSSDETVATVSNGVVTGKSSGTAVITVTTVDGGFTATCSVTVTDSPSPTPGDEYVLEFKTFSSDSGTKLTTSNLLSSDRVKTNTLAASASSVSNLFDGKSGLKLGSGSDAGSFTVSLKTEASKSITGIEIYSTKYSSDTGSLKYTLGSKNKTFTPGSDFSETFDSSIDASTLKIETTAKRAYLSKVVLKVGSTPVSYKSISATIDPSYKIYVADNLDKSKLTVTLTGDSGSKVIGPDLYSVSGFDSSKSGSNTITITYSKQTPNLTCNLTLTILANPVVSISATTSAQYYAGSTFSYTSLHVSATYANGNVEEVSDYTCSLENGHLFTYEETGSKLITISYQGLSIDKTISIVRNTYVAPSKEEKNISSTSFSDLGGSSSSRVSKTIPLDGINYYFHNAYYYSSSKCVSFGSENQNGGYMQNTTKFKAPIRSVSINYASGSISCDIKVSIDGNTWTSYSSDVVKNNNYYFVKIYYKNDTSVAVASLNNDGIDTTAATKYVNITGFEFTFDGQDTALSLTDYIMYSDTLNQCVTKFDVARNKFLSMSISEQSTFQTSNEYKITVARQRYEAWARSLGKNPYQEGDATAFGILGLNNLTDSSHLVVIATGLFSVATLSTFVLIKRKRSR